MRYMIDPSADAVWDAIVTEVTADGVFTTEPETDEDWMVLRRHAVTLIEATDLLLMEGRRVAAEGSRSELPGVDLEPEEIEALLKADRASWTAFVAVLHEGGVGVLEAIDSQDVDGNWTERCWTGTGFPRVFYLKYHMYSLYFPLFALGMYRNALPGGEAGGLEAAAALRGTREALEPFPVHRD